MGIKWDILKKTGKEKLILLILAGVLLLVISFPAKTSQKETTLDNASGNTVSDVGQDYEAYLEKKIKKNLAQVAGVGKVEVILTLKGTSEKVLVSEDTYAENQVSETDSSGGVRNSLEKSGSQSYLYSDTTSGSQPYVARELTPQVEGVVIIAEGGGDAVVVSNVTKAMEALLNVPVHKIQVLKMTD